MEEKRQPRRDSVAFAQIDRENCQFFGISLSYFFAENESEENEVKTRELIAMLSRLNKAQLDVLTDFLREFTEK